MRIAQASTRSHGCAAMANACFARCAVPRTGIEVPPPCRSASIFGRTFTILDTGWTEGQHRLCSQVGGGARHTRCGSLSDGAKRLARYLGISAASRREQRPTLPACGHRRPSAQAVRTSKCFVAGDMTHTINVDLPTVGGSLIYGRMLHAVVWLSGSRPAGVFYRRGTLRYARTF
jgi:hypothetical protein